MGFKAYCSVQCSLFFETVQIVSLENNPILYGFPILAEIKKPTGFDLTLDLLALYFFFLPQSYVFLSSFKQVGIKI